jgi:nucleotidyltransferase substrate binding protein (TIGR01987 family)
MDTLEIKYTTIQKALESLHQAIIFFDKAKRAPDLPLLGTRTEVYQAARDSIIQRFEFSIELFWKYMRVFMETGKQIKLETIASCDIVRSACQYRFISEDDAQHCIDMIRSRNLTSHIYKEDIAEQLVRDIPSHYELMKKLLESMGPK